MKPKKIHKTVEEISNTASDLETAKTLEFTAKQPLEPDLPSDSAPLPQPLTEAPVEAPVEVPSTAQVHVIEAAREEDRPWIAALWEKYSGTFGGGFQQLWEAYLLGKETNGSVRIDVCRPAEGFHAYTVQPSGISHRAIAATVPCRGVGRALLSSFKGKMFRFVVPVTNVGALAFYNALGCPSQGCSYDGLTGNQVVQYLGIFPGTAKVVPAPLPVGDVVPSAPVKTNWRKG